MAVNIPHSQIHRLTDAYVTAIKILSPSLLTRSSAPSRGVMRTRFRIKRTIEPYYWRRVNCSARKNDGNSHKGLIFITHYS